VAKISVAGSGRSTIRPAPPWSPARHAAQYIIKLPKAQRELPQWETAIECLMLVGEHGGNPMMAHIANALHWHKPKAAPAPRRRTAKVDRFVR
jgi:hypothetical protein